MALKVMHGCEHCNEVNQVFRIKKPQDLRKAIKVASDNINDGTIIESEYWPEGCSNHNNVSFSRLAGGAHWGDTVDYFFECPKCKSLYNLSAETYHGSGGKWAPAERGMIKSSGRS